MLKLFLLLKYLRRWRINLLSVVAVALSVCLMIVVASLFTGFVKAIKRTAAEMYGHIVMEAPEGVPIESYPALIDRLEASDIIECATGTLSSAGLLHIGAGDVRPVQIWGIEPARRARVTGFKDVLLRQKALPGEPSFDVPGQPDATGAYIGIGVVAEPDETTDEYDEAAVLEEMVGQTVYVTTGAAADVVNTASAPRRRRIRMGVSDLTFSGVYELDSGCVYVPIETLQEVMYPDAGHALAMTINIRLRPGLEPEAAVPQVRALWRQFAEEQLGWSTYLIADTDVMTAQQKQRQYIAAIEQQMRVLLLIFGVVSPCIIVLVFCIFYMIIRLKQKDIVVIKSCGVSSFSVAWVFLFFSLFVGTVGSGLGAGLGYLIVRDINTIERWIQVIFGLKLWSSSVYVFSKIPNEVAWAWTLVIVALATVAAVIGAVVPAVIAARTSPVNVLRYE